MNIQDVAVAGYFSMPSDREALRLIALDPLSSPIILARLYYEYNRRAEGEDFRGHHLVDLAHNPSLPSGVFNDLFARLQEMEYSISREPQEVDLLSNFFSNPLTTFEQVLDIVCNSYLVADLVGIEEVGSSKTVVEVFDRLVPLVNDTHRVFISKLLCSPLVSDEDFRLRTASENARLNLHSWTILSSPRFIPSDDDYHIALNSIDASGSYIEFNYGLSIVTNPNSSSEFLADALGRAGGKESVEAWVYANLNCPIELSASFVLENLEEYKWRFSALNALNLKANEYIGRTQGEGPWSDLPLSWKLGMIAG